MADEALRMQAEVIDRFSGPLKSLRSQLLDVSRQGAAHGDVLAKGFGKVEGAIQGTAKAASSVLNPAMMSVGVTSLTAGAALAGVTSALNKLARLIHRAVVCGVFWADGARDRASVLTRVDLDRSVSTGGTGAGLWGHHGPLV